jgi:hypothetical protein
VGGGGKWDGGRTMEGGWTDPGAETDRREEEGERERGRTRMPQVAGWGVRGVGGMGLQPFSSLWSRRRHKARAWDSGRPTLSDGASRRSPSTQTGPTSTASAHRCWTRGFFVLAVE